MPLRRTSAALLVACCFLLASTARARISKTKETKAAAVANDYSANFATCGPDNHRVPCKTPADVNSKEAQEHAKFAVDKLNNVLAPMGKKLSLPKKGAVKVYEYLPMSGMAYFVTFDARDPSGQKWRLQAQVLEPIMAERRLEEFKIAKI